ncbi:MAG: UDP-N-acetylmuramate--L-alanine ligase [Patescibacteria group bacterium]|jgi:UDP-N-acetylmuramate--alanine ligase
MLDVHKLKRVHLVGIGGISMSAVAKLLSQSGVIVSGSDLAETPITKELQAKGIKVIIGPHDERNLAEDCQAVIHTSASRDDNPERIAAKGRHISDLSNFEFLGEWFKDKKVVLVTGTHGKSTTTALLGNMCIKGGLDPTVIIGSRVPGWPDANLRLGNSDLVIIEGDEYARHFLDFHPSALIINNIELDHTDIFKDVDDMRHTFERLLRQTKKDAIVVVNGESEQAMKAVDTIKLHEMKVVKFGRSSTVKLKSQSYDAMMESSHGAKGMEVKINFGAENWKLESSLIGDYNAMNVAAAAVMAHELGAASEAIWTAVKEFAGIWRRMEFVGDLNGAQVYSDYGHHPTAVRETIAGVKQAFPDKRVVLCFQPHHKNRTKQLFDDFVTCFDQADVLILCEIYDVAGRSAVEDADMSSQKLLDAIKDRFSGIEDRDSSLDNRNSITESRVLEYAPNPDAAVKRTFELLQPGDVCVVMGAGDIDGFLRKAVLRTPVSIVNSSAS